MLSFRRGNWAESGERNFLASNLFGVRLSQDFIRAKS